MKALVSTLALVLSCVVSYGQTEAVCTEARALAEQPCMLTIESLYVHTADANGFDNIGLFNEPTQVRVVKVQCDDENGVKLTVTTSSGQTGFFYVADLDALRRHLRPATAADRGVISFK